MKRYIYFFFAAFNLALMFSGTAEATKSSYPSLSCANVRCSQGTVCQNLSNGPQCVIQSSPPGYYLPGAPTRPPYDSPPGYYVPTPPSTYHPPYDQTPPGYYNPNPPNYGSQSCAYGGHYLYGRLICNSAPRWREPYQNGWRNNPYRNRYDNWNRNRDRTPPGYYVPPTYRPQPTPPIHSRPGHGNVPDPIAAPPNRTVCPMNYAPVCATKSVICVKAPCYPVQKTFSNSCMARGQDFTVLYKGECQ